MDFKLQAPFQPMGDQPEAIRGLVEGVREGMKHQVLLGATGTGKTFTIASVIQELQKPALIMAHNKTLAAQLYAEFKEFFPENAVSYFVSYYDYYQPEAYVPRHDLYIEKETEINEEIERLRLAATTALISRRDVIIVASVSCIYGLGSPEEFGKGTVTLKVGEIYRRNALLRQLIESRSTSAMTWNCEPAHSACAAIRWRSSRPMKTSADIASLSSATKWNASCSSARSPAKYSTNRTKSRSSRPNNI